jgi:hypothetical protein
MSQLNPNNSIGKHGFERSLMRLLQDEYSFPGGSRIQWMLVEDVKKLIEECYPTYEQIASGTLIWNCTADDEGKSITLRLPLVTKNDLEGHTERREGLHEREKRQIVRLINAAAEQGGRLTLAELCLILNCSPQPIAHHIQEWQEDTGKTLPLKGYEAGPDNYPTHRAEIVRLFEQGKELPEIVRESGHSLKSVKRYLKDYESVRTLLQSGNDVNTVSLMIKCVRKVVIEYAKIAQEFHPELFDKPVS